MIDASRCDTCQPESYRGFLSENIAMPLPSAPARRVRRRESRVCLISALALAYNGLQSPHEGIRVCVTLTSRCIVAKLAVFIGRLQWVAFAVMMSLGNPAMSQEKAAMTSSSDQIKVMAENEKVVASEERIKPGAETDSRARPYRAVRAMKGGSIQRIYPDGRKEMAMWKTGEVRVFEASGPYKLKNVGKEDVVFYIVGLK